MFHGQVTFRVYISIYIYIYIYGNHSAMRNYNKHPGFRKTFPCANGLISHPGMDAFFSAYFCHGTGFAFCLNIVNFTNTHCQFSWEAEGSLFQSSSGKHILFAGDDQCMVYQLLSINGVPSVVMGNPDLSGGGAPMTLETSRDVLAVLAMFDDRDVAVFGLTVSNQGLPRPLDHGNV